MSISLTDALKGVELEAGRTYRCAVRGHRVELRVLPELADEPDSVDEAAATGGLKDEDIRLDPWCDLPSPRPLARVESRRVAHLPIDIPEIPADEDWS